MSTEFLQSITTGSKFLAFTFQILAIGLMVANHFLGQSLQAKQKVQAQVDEARHLVELVKFSPDRYVEIYPRLIELRIPEIAFSDLKSLLNLRQSFRQTSNIPGVTGETSDAQRFEMMTYDLLLSTFPKQVFADKELMARANNIAVPPYYGPLYWTNLTNPYLKVCVTKLREVVDEGYLADNIVTIQNLLAIRLRGDEELMTHFVAEFTKYIPEIRDSWTDARKAQLDEFTRTNLASYGLASPMGANNNQEAE